MLERALSTQLIRFEKYALKRIVGHSISDITERVYSKRGVEWLKGEIEKIKQSAAFAMQESQCMNSVENMQDCPTFLYTISHLATLYFIIPSKYYRCFKTFNTPTASLTAKQKDNETSLFLSSRYRKYEGVTAFYDVLINASTIISPKTSFPARKISRPQSAMKLHTHSSTSIQYSGLTIL